MNIRAVIFDFGGVICFGPTPEQWTEASRFCGVEETRFREAFWKLRDGYDAGAEAREYWRGVGKLLGVTFDARVIGGLIEREIAFWSKFDERLLSWVTQLRRAGIRTGILSNLPHALGENLRTLPGFIGHFDRVTFSYELGVIKPHRGIYQHSINGLKIAPAEGLFLDDREENVVGGRAAGLHAEQFTSWEDFVARQMDRYNLPQP